MLTSYIIDVEMNYNSSLNIIISLGPIPCFRFVNINVIYLESNYFKTTMSDFGWQ